MSLERYRLRTIEYKMKLAGTPQWAIGIQYSQAWIGFNVTGFTIIPNNIQPPVSFFVNINLADKDQRWFLFEFINIKRILYSMYDASYSQSCITEQKPIPISWLVFVALETVESRASGLGIGLSKSANTASPVLQQSLYCLFAWNWNLTNPLLIGLKVL